VRSQEVPGSPGHDVVAGDRRDDELKEPAPRELSLAASDPAPPVRLEEIERGERRESERDSENVRSTDGLDDSLGGDTACREQQENDARR
jgi:hypothetical protein